jgi:hypothetical protein
VENPKESKDLNNKKVYYNYNIGGHMTDLKKEISRLRSEVRKLEKNKVEIKPFLGSYTDKTSNPFTGVVSGNYWTQTGMPWV